MDGVLHGEERREIETERGEEEEEEGVVGTRLRERREREMLFCCSLFFFLFLSFWSFNGSSFFFFLSLLCLLLCLLFWFVDFYWGDERDVQRSLDCLDRAWLEYRRDLPSIQSYYSNTYNNVMYAHCQGNRIFSLALSSYLDFSLSSFLFLFPSVFSNSSLFLVHARKAFAPLALLPGD